MEKLLESCKDIFREELPIGLTAGRSVDHPIETDLDSLKHRRRILKLSKDELEAVRDYIDK